MRTHLNTCAHVTRSSRNVPNMQRETRSIIIMQFHARLFTSSLVIASFSWKVYTSGAFLSVNFLAKRCHVLKRWPFTVSFCPFWSYFQTVTKINKLFFGMLSGPTSVCQIWSTSPFLWQAIVSSQTWRSSTTLLTSCRPDCRLSSTKNALYSASKAFKCRREQLRQTKKEA